MSEPCFIACSYSLGRLGDGTKVVVIPFLRYKPESGWLLGLEYSYKSRYARYGFLDHDGKIVAAKWRTKKLTFPAPEEAHRFFTQWLARNGYDMETLAFDENAMRIQDTTKRSKKRASK
jgi:hypothetical protein